MHALITEARRRHVAEIFLEVRADNPIARALYESLGFEEIGVRRATTATASTPCTCG